MPPVQKMPMSGSNLEPRVARYSDLVTLGLARLPEYSTGHMRNGGLPRWRKRALVTSACASPNELLLIW